MLCTTSPPLFLLPIVACITFPAISPFSVVSLHPPRVLVLTHSDVVWAGCHGLQVRFEDSGEQLDTGFHEMAEDYADLVEERSQFKVRCCGEKGY